MWLIAAYIVSALIILALIFHDNGWYKGAAGSTIVVWVIVSFIPLINTVVALLVIAQALSGYFMTKATRKFTGDPDK